MTIHFSKLKRSPNYFLALTCVLIGLVCTCAADTITLKDGKKFEGKLISQSTTEVKFEVGKSVKEVRTFKPSEVDSLDVITPDQIAFKSIEQILPTADLLDENEYRRILNGLPKRFISSYPDSTLKGEVEKVIETLEAEQKMAAAGDVKVNGKWITAKEIEADRYNHEALVSLAKLNQLVEADAMLKSLREFDRLETRYVESISYPLAVARVKGILPLHAEKLVTRLEQTIAGNESREKQIENMRFEEREAADAAYAREMNRFLKRHEEEKKSGAKWLDFHIWDEGSVKYAQKEVADEIKRIDRIDVADLTNKARILKEVALELRQENFQSASDKFAAYGRPKSGTRADDIKDQIAAGLKGREIVAKNAAVVKEIKRDEASSTATEKTETEPDPAPEVEPASTVSTESSSSGDPGADLDDPFREDDPEEEKKKSRGISLLTILLLLIPIMGIVTFLSIRSAKKNQVDDFVPVETEE